MAPKEPKPVKLCSIEKCAKSVPKLCTETLTLPPQKR